MPSWQVEKSSRLQVDTDQKLLNDVDGCGTCTHLACKHLSQTAGLVRNLPLSPSSKILMGGEAL